MMRGVFETVNYVLPPATYQAMAASATAPAAAASATKAAARIITKRGAPPGKTLSGVATRTVFRRGPLRGMGDGTPPPTGGFSLSGLFTGPGTIITAIPDGFVYAGGALALIALFGGKRGRR